MKKLIYALLLLAMLFSLAVPAYAADPNIDGGGGGMGQGTGQNSWTPGRDGVRITVVRDSDNTPVSTPIDFSNGSNSDMAVHFGKVSKISYRNSTGLTPHTSKYACYQPSQAMPRIVSSNGSSNIAAIRSYFCREGTIRDIANATGLGYDTLINGKYKILLEPIAYFKYNSVMFAMTATEAALYNKQVGNGLRSKMVSLSHKNLPLSMFLETPDLGFPAWSGSTTKAQSDETIITYLGMGVIRFSEPDPEPPKESKVTYRTDTEVITVVTLTTGSQKTPDNPAYARFFINGKTYSHTDIYIPEDGSQLAWVKWRTPKEPGLITITVTSNCSLSSSEIVAEIVDLDKNPPPDPQANDRNDGFRIPSAPNKPNTTTLTWGEWDCWWHEHWVWHSGDDDEDGYWEDEGWFEYAWLSYSASLTANLSTKPDEKVPTASGKTMKSGYGLNASVSAQVRFSAPSSHITGVQNVVAYFPEFNYSTYWRLLKRLNTGYSSTFEFQKNKYSTYGQPCHFSPVWFPDGRYTTYTECLDSWTPAGMLQINLTDDLTIRGTVFDDWHIRAVK
ncbi:hypothetical protein QA584_08850 [Anaerocolumna sp. AGMB13025]|uniref:hypothetical protein n=1 Tax=Anaerocolumna sp. AGMB13025 TaxID=3039116 RepID=UPI00241DA4B6|nr:hypothetical protein [Anaerocolumna sp. AGMB13025]WFR59176.1 hypothetical protein QA584_08850 [Anaerocolumna sp. AGMB13025]